MRKREDAGNTFSKKKTTDHSIYDCIKLRTQLQGIHDLALFYAIKYRFDPCLKQVHEEYLNMITGILEECEK